MLLLVLRLVGELLGENINKVVNLVHETAFEILQFFSVGLAVEGSNELGEVVLRLILQVV